jgi:hypothetical protein
VDAIKCFLHLKLEVKEDTTEELVLKKMNNSKKKKEKRDEKKDLDNEARKTSEELEMSLREADAG